MNTKDKIFRELVKQHNENRSEESRALMRELARKKFPSEASAHHLVDSTRDAITHALVASNVHSPPSVLNKLIDMKDIGIINRIAHNRSADRSVFRNLEHHANEYENREYKSDPYHQDDIRRGMLSNKNLPEEFHSRLLPRLEENSTRYVAVNSENPGVLEKLSAHPHPGLRQMVALNKDTPIKIKERMANEDESTMVRVAATRDKRHSPDFLHKLAGHEDRNVRLAVAEHKNTKPETIAHLANDHFYNIRTSIANNEMTPYHILEKMKKDKNEFIAKYAQDTINMKQSLGHKS